MMVEDRREPDDNVGWYLVQQGIHEAGELVDSPLFLGTPGENTDGFVQHHIAIDKRGGGRLERFAQRVSSGVPYIVSIDESHEHVCIDQDLFRRDHRRAARRQ